MNTGHRFPGLRPFSGGEANVFFGREGDSKSLEMHLGVSNITVLYGRSGVGKSSLVNASLARQAISADWECHFLHASPLSKSDLMEGMLYNMPRVIEQDLSPVLKYYSESAGIDPNSLWFRLKQRALRVGQMQRFLLIFDQFEEVFDFPEVQVHSLKKELADILSANPPGIQEAIEKEPNFSDIMNPLQVKLLFILRSDSLHYLTRLEDVIPGILKNKIEIRPPQIEQARAALERPASMEGDFYSSIPFRFEQKALEAILRSLQNEKGEIEPFQLQLVASSIESLVVEQHIDVIDTRLIPNIKEIFGKFYGEMLDKFEPDDNHKIREMIEEELIFEGPSGGIRVAANEYLLIEKYNLRPELLHRLVDLRLLRLEAVANENSYMIIHDSLIGPILESKHARHKEQPSRMAYYPMHLENLRLKRTRNLLILILIISVLLNLLYLLKKK
jgi:hypothetical protein